MTLRRIRVLALALALSAALASAYGAAQLRPRTSITLIDGAARTVVDGGGLDADFFCGASGAPHPAVVLLGGSEGGRSWSANAEHVRRLLDAGYCVLSLAYFGAPGLPDRLRWIPLEYFERAFDWLATRPEVIADRYAVIGGSRGGELALLLGARYPQVRAVVALSPSSVVFPSPPSDALDGALGQHAPWTYRGADLPFLRIPLSPVTLRAIATGEQRPMFEEALRDAAASEAAAIPVERTNGPILLVSATLDRIWPSTAMSEALTARLASRGFAFPYRHVAYERPHDWCGLDPCWNEVLHFLAATAIFSGT